MKAKLLASALLLLVCAFVSANAVLTTRAFASYVRRIEAIGADEGIYAEAQQIYLDFQATERYIALTVAHDDLARAEDAFAEWVGAAQAEDAAQLTIAKSRLTDTLRHLGRLCGIHADSIL